jgi:hypothetical protein
MRSAAPASTPQHTTDFTRQLTWRAGDVGPESPQGEPAARGISAVTPAVTHTSVAAFVAQPTVQLDEHPLFDVAPRRDVPAT